MRKPYKKFVWARRDRPREQFVWARKDYQPTEEELSNIYVDATPEGCFSDSDCPSGQICVPGPEGGTCTEESVSLIIRGFLDNRACDYCRAQFGTIRALYSHNLPPFHEHCRCWAELVYD
jgi:Cys-rich repeat protein